MNDVEESLLEWTDEALDLLDMSKIDVWMEEEGDKIEGNTRLCRELVTMALHVVALRRKFTEIVKTYSQQKERETIMANVQIMSSRIQSALNTLLLIADQDIAKVSEMFSGNDRAAFLNATTWTFFIKRVLSAYSEIEEQTADEVKTFVYVLFSVRKHLQDLGVVEDDWFGEAQENESLPEDSE